MRCLVQGAAIYLSGEFGREGKQLPSTSLGKEGCCRARSGSSFRAPYGQGFALAQNPIAASQLDPSTAGWALPAASCMGGRGSLRDGAASTLRSPAGLQPPRRCRLRDWVEPGWQASRCRAGRRSAGASGAGESCVSATAAVVLPGDRRVSQQEGKNPHA